jgi:hypothetical protein
MTNLPTEPHAIVRVLLSGMNFASGERERRIAEHNVMITGKATPRKWPGHRLGGGELEGIVWTTAGRLLDVVNDLRDNAGVLDACAEIDDSPESR